MKVLSTTPDRLTLGARPWALGAGIGLAAIVAAGFALSYLQKGDTPGAIMAAIAFAFCISAFLAFVRRVIVFLDRPSGLIVLREATVFGQTETTRPLQGLRLAEVDTNAARNSDDADTHRPVLRFDDGSILPLTTVFVSGNGAARAAAAVNEWLAR